MWQTTVNQPMQDPLVEIGTSTAGVPSDVDVAIVGAPFGGVNESAYGREGSHWGLDESMHTKYLCRGNLG